MAALRLFRGRLLDHLHLVVRDLSASRRFYEAVLNALQVPIGGEGPGFFWADELFISSVDSPAAAGVLTGRLHVAFSAADRDTVARFHASGLAAGGTDNGAPGERPYHPGYFAAYLLDPDGNNVEAVHHGTAQRSAPAVIIDVG